MEKNFSRANGCTKSSGILAEHKETLRPLTPEDIPQVKALCADCFPIDYPESWFTYITSGKVYTLGCFLPVDCSSGCGQLIAMVIGEEQLLQQLECEVGPVLASASTPTTIMYIVSLGVLGPHRKQGVGSLLMNSLLAHVTDLPTCRAVYLHVQASNSSAQRFYRQLGFREFCLIHDYYLIRGNREDAFLYCCYTNGGVAFPHTFRGYLWRHWEGVHHCVNSTWGALAECFNQIPFKS